MKKNSHVIISGAGIAGLTSAIWLSRAGHQVTIIEKSPEIRADGFIVSLSHKSFHYAKELGILPELMERYTGIQESSYIDHKGNNMLKLDYQQLFKGVNIIQIMRDELQSILYEKASQYDIDFQFSQTIQSISNNFNHVDVTLEDGRSLNGSLLIGADGLHSNTRRLVFLDSECQRHYFGLFSAAFRLDNVLALKNQFESHLDHDRYMCVYTTGKGDLACVFIWKNTDLRAPTQETRLASLKKAFSTAAPPIQAVLRNCPSNTNIYMDPLVQIHMPNWHKGNVVLLGDAAHAMTLLSGQGASTAFWGASSLSENLLKQEPIDAFKCYQRELRPVVLKTQSTTQNAKNLYIPKNAFTYTLRNSLMRYLPNGFFQRYFKNKYSSA